MAFGAEARGSQNQTETYLLLCPTMRDDRELGALASGANFIRQEYATDALEKLVGTAAARPSVIADPLAEIGRILAGVSNQRITGVISTDDYPGTALACAMAKILGLPGTDPGVSLLCQHKYHARLAQQALVPEAVPQFVLIDVDRIAELPATIPLPAFIKPVKSFFSIGAQQLVSLQQLAMIQKRWAGRGAFFHPFERLLDRYAKLKVGRGFLLIENALQGVQATIEGYAFGSEIHIVGIVDSIMFPRTMAFERFEYPSSLPASVQKRMARIAKKLMGGLGFRDAMFNIEFMYDSETDTIGIIEINPRMASQFADLYEKVDGFNTYSVLLDLAGGRKPRLPRCKGLHRMAASCVFRIFQDQLVISVPSRREIEKLVVSHPGIRVEILASAGRRLSDEMQDGSSFRYGIVNLGGRDRHDIREKFEECRRQLTFTFAPVGQLTAERRRGWSHKSSHQDRAGMQSAWRRPNGWT